MPRCFCHALAKEEKKQKEAFTSFISSVCLSSSVCSLAGRHVVVGSVPLRSALLFLQAALKACSTVSLAALNPAAAEPAGRPAC
jgi:hypothetical protein